MQVFKRVVELESFSVAARDLGLSNAAVSKNIGELEAHLNIRLLNRTTRRMSVTEAGQVYYQRCVQLLEDLDEADRALSHLSDQPFGTLKISAPMSFGILHLAAAIADFSREYPRVNVDLVLNDEYISLVESGCDVAIRGGSALESSNLIARPLTSIRRVLCASPAYLSDKGVPQTPADLAEHHCLFYSLSRGSQEWTFIGSDGEQTIKIPVRHRVNNTAALTHWLIAGMGISLVPTFAVSDALRDGRLQAVMTNWQASPQALYGVYLHRKFIPPKVRVFIDFLVRRFQPVAQWDNE